MTRWTTADIPDLASGPRPRTIVITGATSGLGRVAATELAAKGARVVLAVRDTERGRQAAVTMGPGPVEVRHCDLADLSTVRGFAESWGDEPIDVLLNNAGVMAIPRRTTVDGFEMQFATNHLGHFALTGLLLPALTAHEGARVVTVSSQAHRMGRMNFDDLQGERRYRAWGAYGQSKLANLLFTGELDRRARDHGLSLIAVAAHPGYAATNLQSVAPRMQGRGWQERLMDVVNGVLAQSAEMGTLPLLYAATAPGLPGGAYIGPDGFGEQRGHPRLVGMTAAAKDRTAAERLWRVSEELTGVRYLD